MAEQTMAERYKEASIQREVYWRALNELQFENDGESKKGDAYVELLTLKKKSKERQAEIESRDAEEMLATDLADARNVDSEYIEKLREELASSEISDSDREYTEYVIKAYEKRVAMSDDEYISDYLVSGMEDNVVCLAAECKGESLVKAIGLQGDINYHAQKIEGLSDPEIIGNLSEQEIEDAAVAIRKSDWFKHIKASDRLGKIGAVLTVGGLGTGLIGGIVALGGGALSLAGVLNVNENVLGAGAIAEAGGLATGVAGMLMAHIANKEEDKIGEIHLADFISEDAKPANESEQEK